VKIITVGSYNAHRVHRDPNKAGERDRYGHVADVINEADADIWAIQELDNPSALAELADATGMTCFAPVYPLSEDPRIACDCGGYYGVGLMWRPELQVVPDSLYIASHRPSLLYNGLVKVTFDIDGTKIQAASTLLTCFGRERRIDEAEFVAANITRTPGKPPTLLGADFNVVSADRICDDRGNWVYHDPDPYTHLKWRPDFTYQCLWDYDTKGTRTNWRADRRASETLLSAGLSDVQAELHQFQGGSLAWKATTGHWPDDPYGPRSPDGIRVTDDLLDTLRTCEVHNTELARSTSDHLPFTVDFDVHGVAR
jgi:endonuclease/exonuclease/phosphatase family metal-dependent hydrolase